MNRKVKQMIREIERRGGIVGGFDKMPAHEAQRVLQQILDCPCCADGAPPIPFERRVVEMMPIDVLLGGTRGH